MLVVDASIALAWALPDESNRYADAALACVVREGIHVPDLWPHEVANGLAITHLRQRITLEQQREFIGALFMLPIRVEQRGALDAIVDGVESARLYGLTAYDSAYVSLAAREKLLLARLDKRMREAALKSGVMILEG